MTRDEAEKLIDELTDAAEVCSRAEFVHDNYEIAERASKKIDKIKIRLLAALTTPGPSDDLHRKIMNMPEDENLVSQAINICVFDANLQPRTNDVKRAYLMGCRDTRHAAAEIVVAYFNNRP